MSVLTSYPFATLIGVTRSTTDTCFDSTGAMVVVPINTPAIDHNPATLAPRGLRVPEARTNIFLNSLLDGTNLATQTVTVTAALWTVSFYGTGVVTLSGAHTAVITGSGATTLTSLTFTPTAGALTATVAGQVKWANCELGASPGPFIPTAGSQVTRTATVPVMTGANFTSWYNATEMTFVVKGTVLASSAATAGTLLSASDGTNNEFISATQVISTGVPRVTVSDGGASQAIMNGSAITLGNTVKAAFRVKANDFAVSYNGGAVVTDTAGTMPSPDRLYIGVGGTGAVSFANGWIESIVAYPTAMTNAKLVELSTI
jgi:hypothetical protein